MAYTVASYRLHAIFGLGPLRPAPFKQAQHETFALRHLLESNEFVWLVRLLDAARAADHGGHAAGFEDDMSMPFDNIDTNENPVAEEWGEPIRNWL